MILGPGLERTVGEETVENLLTNVATAVDAKALHYFLGDLAICLAWEALPTVTVATNAFTTDAAATLKQKIAQQKRRRFARVADSHWAELFGAQGKRGNRSCVVCRRPLAKGEAEPENSAGTDEITGELTHMCSVCADFRKLAEAIGRAGVNRLILNDAPPSGGELWQHILYDIGGVTYHFDTPRVKARRERSYLLNDTAFVDAGAHGFRFLANTTPRVTQLDVDRWQVRYGDRAPAELDEDDQRPQIGHIRSFSQMADVARGVKRLGVLRMDVDSLGAVIVRGLPTANLPAIMALSRMLSLFFSGWLNEICRDLNQQYAEGADGEALGDRLYVIYAGGDDLFVVGSWDLMPALAQRIHDDFTAYTGGNPNLTISGGITLEGRKFPLYQAAERAGDAEKAAKEYKRNGKTKDAITFLGVPLQWDEWLLTDTSHARLIGMVKPDKPETPAAPAALLRILQNVYVQHGDMVRNRRTEQLRAAGRSTQWTGETIHFGPWMWRQAYALTRMAGRAPAHKESIYAIQHENLSPDYVRYNGLAARWVELLVRKGGEE